MPRAVGLCVTLGDAAVSGLALMGFYNELTWMAAGSLTLVSLLAQWTHAFANLNAELPEQINPLEFYS